MPLKQKPSSASLWQLPQPNKIQGIFKNLALFWPAPLGSPQKPVGLSLHKVEPHQKSTSPPDPYITINSTESVECNFSSFSWPCIKRLGVALQKKTRRKVPEPGGWSKNCAPRTYNAWGGQLQKAFKGRSKVYRMKFWLRLGSHFNLILKALHSFFRILGIIFKMDSVRLLLKLAWADYK